MIRIIDNNSNVILMEVKEAKDQKSLQTGTEIELFGQDRYVIKELDISPIDPSSLNVFVEKKDAS